MFGADEVDGDELDLRFEPLLGEHDADTGRIWKARAIEDFHERLLYLSIDR
jgi:hypothetical protein